MRILLLLAACATPNASTCEGTCKLRLDQCVSVCSTQQYGQGGTTAPLTSGVCRDNCWISDNQCQQACQPKPSPSPR
jgi:hypothetical protein